MADSLIATRHEHTGAPGMGMLFCRAYEVFKHRRYLDAALAAGDVVWQRGLLKKGLGLCHGIAGTFTTPRLFLRVSQPVQLRC